MGQTLTHGIYLPEEGERNCYAGLAANWQLLDGAVGTVAEHTTQIAGKAPAVHTHTKADITDFPAYGNTAGTICEGNDSRLSDARTPVAHTHTKSDITDLLNSNFIPSANNSYDLGSSSYQWNNLYAKNYYYNGVAWGLDKANAWSDNNIFSKNVGPASVTSVTDTTLAFNGLYNTIFLNTRGSSNRRSYGSFLFAGYGTASGVDNYGQIQLLRSTDKRGDTNEGYVPDTSFKMWRVAPHSLIMDSMEAVRVTNDGTENSLKPITNNATDLGTSDNKWKTLNGINPGALSLPNMNATGVDISSYIVYPTGETSLNLSGGSNKYTASENGWLVIVKAVTACRYIKTVINTRLGAVTVPAASMSGSVYHCQPVPAGQTVSIVLDCDSAPGLYFYPCLGNV